MWEKVIGPTRSISFLERQATNKEIRWQIKVRDLPIRTALGSLRWPITSRTISLLKYKINFIKWITNLQSILGCSSHLSEIKKQFWDLLFHMDVLPWRNSQLLASFCIKITSCLDCSFVKISLFTSSFSNCY